MKKRISKIMSLILILIVSAMTLTACGKFTCDVCGKEKTGKRYDKSFFGVEYTICADCQENVDDLKSLFSK